MANGLTGLGHTIRGSRKGILNKTTSTAKENIIAVFNRLNGTAAMADWARENRTEFYKLYARLIPVENHLSAPSGGPIAITWPVPKHPLES